MVVSLRKAFGIDHRQDLLFVGLLPPPSVANDFTIFDWSDLLPEAQDRVDIRLEMPPPVPAEDELVAIDVDVLVADPVIGAARPAFEVRKDAMDPGQDLVRLASSFLAQIKRKVKTPIHIVVTGVLVSEDHGPVHCVPVDEVS